MKRSGPRATILAGTANPNMKRRSSVVGAPIQLGRSRPGSPDDISEGDGGSIKSSATSGRASPGSVNLEEKSGKHDTAYRHPEGTYEGETNINLVPHGYGTYYYKNGDVYEGYWENGIREGEGEMKYATNESYKGTYHLSLANGRGIYIFKNGDRYDGDFKGGYMNGRGTYTYSGGGVYKGIMRKGSKCDNHGMFKYPNGDVYMGRFHENKPHGKGTIVFPKSRENPNPKPLDVWNGKLIETDVRPSQNGAYTNFNEDDDIPMDYPETESSDSSSDDETDASSQVSRYTMGTVNSVRSNNVPGSGAGTGPDNSKNVSRSETPTIFE